MDGSSLAHTLVKRPHGTDAFCPSSGKTAFNLYSRIDAFRAMRRATAFLLCCALGAVAASTNDDDDDDSESLKTESHGMMCRLCMKVVASIEKGTGQGEKFANVRFFSCFSSFTDLK